MLTKITPDKIHAELIKEFGKECIVGHHAFSDLYVAGNIKIYKWLLNEYEYPKHVSVFIDQTNGKPTIEIIFAYNGENQ